MPAFPGCGAARLCASSTRYGGALLIRGPVLDAPWIPALRCIVPDDAEPVIGRAFARPVGIAGRTLHRVRDTVAAQSEARITPPAF
jgi:hypothetical protein